MNQEKIVELGRVISTDGSVAVVEVGAADACSRCSAKGVCTSASSGRRYTITVLNRCDARQGDDVMIEITGGRAVYVAFIVYGLPVLLMLASAFTAAALWGETWAPAGLGAGLVAGLAAIRFASPKKPVPEAVLRLAPEDGTVDIVCDPDMAARYADSSAQSSGISRS